MSFANDQFPRVRAEVIHVVTQCLLDVDSIPRRSEFYLFKMACLFLYFEKVRTYRKYMYRYFIPNVCHFISSWFKFYSFIICTSCINLNQRFRSSKKKQASKYCDSSSNDRCSPSHNYTFMVASQFYFGQNRWYVINCLYGMHWL